MSHNFPWTVLVHSTTCICHRQDIGAALSKIEPEKTLKVQEAKSFLVSNPTCASAPQLNSKVDNANKKYAKVEQLLKLSQEKYVTQAASTSSTSEQD